VLRLKKSDKDIQAYRNQSKTIGSETQCGTAKSEMGNRGVGKLKGSLIRHDEWSKLTCDCVVLKVGTGLEVQGGSFYGIL